MVKSLEIVVIRLNISSDYTKHGNLYLDIFGSYQTLHRSPKIMQGTCISPLGSEDEYRENEKERERTRTKEEEMENTTEAALRMSAAPYVDTVGRTTIEHILAPSQPRKSHKIYSHKMCLAPPRDNGTHQADRNKLDALNLLDILSTSHYGKDSRSY